MTDYTDSITIEREKKQYYAYSEDFPGVYGVGASMEDAKTSIFQAILFHMEHKKTGRP